MHTYLFHLFSPIIDVKDDGLIDHMYWYKCMCVLVFLSLFCFLIKASFFFSLYSLKCIENVLIIVSSTAFLPAKVIYHC